VAPTRFDQAALLYARTRFHAPRAERLIAAYSRLGEHGACWLALGAIGALTDHRPLSHRKWLRGMRIVAAAYGLNFAVKLVVHRSRPELVGLPPLTKTVSRLSFPSAHVTTSFAAAWAFRELAPPAWLYAAAIAFALSRPYLGVHYPSDVLGGAALGTAIAAAWPQPRRQHAAWPQPRRPHAAWPQPRRPQPAWQKRRTP
jgi:membrane-associated phospholipid phosphatase